MLPYIARTLHCAGDIVRDEDVVSKSGVLVVLAEPGAGKTAFLDYLARHFGVRRIPAPTLVGRKIPVCSALIIDSLDEVARLDALQTNSILLEAAAAGASTIVVACRSYVWSEARTKFARDCFRCEPMVMARGNRCDSTVSTVIGGVETVLVIEAKGQWNRELYTAALTQLADRYAIYPGAADQGLYLVFWYGPEEKIVGRSDPSITSAADLRRSITDRMPSDLLGRIDVVVLDVSIGSPTTRAR